MILRSLLKAALVLALAILAQGVIVGTVLADNGPHVQAGGSAGATAMSEVCATCHRAHQTAGASLTAAASERSLCLTCHGSSALGSILNVSDGVLAGTNSGSRASGFVNALMDTSWVGNPVARPVTSSHMTDGVTGTMWGSGDIGSGPGQPGVALGCTSCHDPHGNGNYRILRPLPEGAAGTGTISVPDEAVKSYAVTSTADRYFGQVYMDGNYEAQLALNRWCATCHTRFDAPGLDAAHVASGDSIYTYRHRTRAVDPASGNCDACHLTATGEGDAVNILGISSATAHVPLCENCHVAHGSAAQMSQGVATVAQPDGTLPAPGTVDSTLLRLDGRGVCRACHGR
ncbi:MAG: cytochrome c3 family protein [Chloroflexota bacterium]